MAPRKPRVFVRPFVRPFVCLLALVALVAVAIAFVASRSTPGSTSSIQLVDTTVQSGYRVEFYRNLAYPCSISGYQTFAIASRDGQPVSSAQPLWVHLHGGAVGWFDAGGRSQPTDEFMREESLGSFLGLRSQPGLMPLVFGDAAGFRVLAVSMCNRDLYSGAGQIDPHNPNLTAAGKAKATNGLLATKAAIRFARTRFATPRFVLHGVSAGSVGTYSVGWSLQQQGIPPAGVVADSFVINQEWAQAVLDQGVPCPVAAATLTHVTEVKARIHPELANVANEPDKVVASGRFTVPVLQAWSHGDPWGCGARPMACPLRDGSTITLGSSDCMNEPMRRAIAGQGPTSRSRSLSLCVGASCRQHVVTAVAGTNTDPAAPVDYNAAIMSWVRDRLADP